MVKTIKATSRASVKIRDSFYTFEYCEEHSVDNISNDNELDIYRQELWNKVNSEVDNQIEDIVVMLQEK